MNHYGQQESQVAIRNKMSLPRFRPGKQGPQIFSSDTMNVLCRALEALMNPRIVRGERDDVQISEGNLLLTLAGGASGSGTSATVRKLILNDASQGNYLLCRPWNEQYWTARRGLRNDLGYTAFHALSEEDYLNALAESMVTSREVLDAYLDAENLVPVARCPDLAQVTFDGLEQDIVVESLSGSTTIILGYAYQSANYRRVEQRSTDDDSVLAEEQETILPRFVPEESIIHAFTSDQIERVVSGVNVKLMDMNVAGRQWYRTQ